MTTLVAVAVFLHSILRPVASELLRKSKVVASDGFIDHDPAEGEEETLVFSKDTTRTCILHTDMPMGSPGRIVTQVSRLFDASTTLKKRNKNNLAVPLAKEEEEKNL